MNKGLVRFIPNILTMIRVILVIPIYLFLSGGFKEKLLALFILAIAGLTDFLDGKIARKYKVESEFGNFMDPLADKLIVLSIFISFLKLDSTIFPYWMVWLIICREFIITALRIGGIKQESKVETLYIGKVKTTSQFVAIVFILITLILKDYLIETKVIEPVPGLLYVPFDQVWFNFSKGLAYFISYLPSILLGVATFFSLYSGFLYLKKNKELFLGSSIEDERI